MNLHPFFRERIRVNAKIRQRWEALRRNENYKKDRANAFAAYMKRIIAEGKRPGDDLDAEILFHFSPEGIELARKYNLQLPFNPNDELFKPLNYSKNSETLQFFKVFLDDIAVTVIPQIAVSGSLGDADTPRSRDDSPYLRNGRYLVLAIDLHKPKKQIMAEIDYHVEGFATIKKVRGPAIEFYLDTPTGKVTIYEIWDMCHKGGKSPWKIAQKLFPEVKGTSYQPYTKNYRKETRTIWKNINEAIKRADNKISSFSPAT